MLGNGINALMKMSQSRRRKMKERTKLMRSLGLCTKCGQEKEPDYVTCYRCRRKVKINRWLKKDYPKKVFHNI